MLCTTGYSPSMTCRDWAWWGAAALAVGCGARSTLDLSGQDAASAGVGAGTSSSAATGAGGSEQPAVPCTYRLSGAPEVAIALPDRHATSAQLVTTNDDPEQGPLAIAVEYIASGGTSPLHPENPITRFQLEPSTARLTEGSTVVAGVESHSYGLLARNDDRIALAWFTDVGAFGRAAVRTIGVADQSLGPLQDLEPGSSSVTSLVSGPSVEAGAFDGDGYAVTWRRAADPGAPTTRAMAVLDDDGRVVSGPFDVTPAIQTPPSTALVWSGEHYLIATSYGPDCPPNEPLCARDAVVIHRFSPPIPDAPPVSSVTAIAVRPGESASPPRLVHHDGRTFLFWAESDGEQLELRLVELDGMGVPMASPSTIMTTNEDARWTAHASDQGIAVAWLELSGDDGPPDQPGAAFLQVLALDQSGVSLETIDPVPVTLPQGAAPSVGALGGTPRSLAIGWSGRGANGYDVTYLARLRCVEAGS